MHAHTHTHTQGIPFIALEGDKFRLTEEAKEFLHTLKSPIALASIVGKYRTGKSLLVNRMLLDVKGGGFQVCGVCVCVCVCGVFIPRISLPVNCLLLIYIHAECYMYAYICIHIHIRMHIVQEKKILM